MTPDVKAALPVCNTLWIGPALNPIERACFRSVMRQGHKLTLYCYDKPDGVPEGVEIADAAEIVPPERIMRYRSGSPALFANLFRYELQRLRKGIWLDADMYLVKPITLEEPHIFGWQGVILNTAVLRLPVDSPLLPPLISLFEEREIPPWLPPDESKAAAERLRTTGRTGLADMPWGTTGPYALTVLAERYHLEQLAQPVDVFYPAPFRRAGWISNPATRLEDIVSPRTIGVHLWNKMIAPLRRQAAPPGSFLARLRQEGA